MRNDLKELVDCALNLDVDQVQKDEVCYRVAMICVDLRDIHGLSAVNYSETLDYLRAVSEELEFEELKWTK